VEGLTIQLWDIRKEFMMSPGIDNIFWVRCGGLQLAEKLPNS
jgi:hypothetical protein